MKRYEKMSKKEIIEFYTDNANTSPDFIIKHDGKVVSDYLYQEIETKPRWATIKSNKHIDNMYKSWCSNDDDCDSCDEGGPGPLACSDCFLRWLKEEVEV